MGEDFVAFLTLEGDAGRVVELFARLFTADGRAIALDDLTMVDSRHWCSPTSGIHHPTAFEVSSSRARLMLSVCAAFDDQEVTSVLSEETSWEGAVRARGSCLGRRASARGWFEQFPQRR